MCDRPIYGSASAKRRDHNRRLRATATLLLFGHQAECVELIVGAVDGPDFVTGAPVHRPINNRRAAGNRSAAGERPFHGAGRGVQRITETKRAQARQELLLREMDHRVKNLFTLAISILSLSGRSATSVPQLIDSASARLSALARAHALTSPHGPEALRAAGQTTLHSLIEAITAPHVDQGNARRFSIIGCDMEISGSVISSLALLLHEFATNSVKYGALSSTAGQIEVHCVDRAETVVITWSEHGGPPVVPPIGNEGFGDLLIRATVAGQLGGDISREWKPEGLVIRLSLPRQSVIKERPFRPGGQPDATGPLVPREPI
jgi:two-component sensor histidine kinase